MFFAFFSPSFGIALNTCVLQKGKLPTLAAFIEEATLPDQQHLATY